MFEISPPTHSSGRFCSINRRAMKLSWLTVMGAFQPVSPVDSVDTLKSKSSCIRILGMFSVAQRRRYVTHCVQSLADRYGGTAHDADRRVLIGLVVDALKAIE